ncbi:flagellar M-ring protein FliF [Methyloglobulus morosus KoM1]|uniref:Flagellar M-ring protein n=1 Tax=Methyloglobulus morosus KoM1 TaxID=1116472 RepID=V5BZS7_9GAMM|nr:flagellar basal-body MS-ring/collar protein FliF [Methyloglobulus morosus]ESS73334.1 flagellar M-ring protein FliF [Methyloglobulus morosus KoM1]
MSEKPGKNLAETKGIQQVLTAKSNAHPAVKGLSELPIARQLGLMLGLAFSVAIGVAIVLWSQESSYSRLYAEIGEKDVTEILEVLNTQNIKYKVENGSGAIMVPTDEINQIKLKLAAVGLPKSNSVGYELLDKDQGFGSSKSVELVRFQRALEGEIAQTIMAIQGVKTARVLLAIPQQSVFMRDRKKPSASVVVNLYQGRSLDKGQIESIIHLVSSSVPQLDADQVTVVDQKGHLLNSRDSSSVSNLTTKQFEYKKNIEEHLMERIGNIMSPMVGDGVRVQVSADVDFTETDKTQELFDPKSSVLRSEQTSEEQNKMPATQGVPGALSNQPTAAAAAPETTPASGTAPSPAVNPSAETASASGSTAKNATRNFEVDKTITHTRMATGSLRRLSVAVVVDDKRITQADGKVTAQPYKPEEITRFTDLVKQAVGFDNARGDQVTVTNVAFKAPEAPETLPEPPLWKQDWVLNLLKQVGAILVVVFILLGVLRPAMRNLSGIKKGSPVTEDELRAALGELVYDQNGKAVASLNHQQQGTLALPHDIEDLLLVDVPPTYGRRLEYLQSVVDKDPQLVAQVLKRWVR